MKTFIIVLIIIVVVLVLLALVVLPRARARRAETASAPRRNIWPSPATDGPADAAQAADERLRRTAGPRRRPAASRPGGTRGPARVAEAERERAAAQDLHERAAELDPQMHEHDDVAGDPGLRARDIEADPGLQAPETDGRTE